MQHAVSDSQSSVYDQFHHRRQHMSDDEIEGISKMIRDWMDRQMGGYFLTFMFNHIQGDHETKWGVMETEIKFFHKKLTHHVIRNPKNPLRTFLIPRAVVCADYPVWKHKKISRRMLHRPNAGLHAHGVFAVPYKWDEEIASINFPQSRLKVELDEHIQAYHDQYLGKGALCRIEANRITHGTMADYLFKSIKHGTCNRGNWFVV